MQPNPIRETIAPCEPNLTFSMFKTPAVDLFQCYPAACQETNNEKNVVNGRFVGGSKLQFGERAKPRRYSSRGYVDIGESSRTGGYGLDRRYDATRNP